MKRFSASAGLACEEGAFRLRTSLSTTPQERLDSTSMVVREKEKDVHGNSVLFPEEKRGLCSAFLLQRSRATLTLTTSSETTYRREGSTAAPPKKKGALSPEECAGTRSLHSAGRPVSETSSSRARRLRRCRKDARYRQA